MNRLRRRLESVRQAGKKALSLFVTAGFPEAGDTAALVEEAERAGADLVELGMPFSDPIADGPAIQASSQRALANGITVQKAFDMVRAVRSGSDIPLVLMGYSNPILAYGMERFVEACRDSGADGIIVPDLPLEESGEYRALCDRHGIASIFLATPTTPPARLKQLDAASSGFLYAVSVTGVTGERPGLSTEASEFLRAARPLVSNNPLLAGFGISSPGVARAAACLCDGVIVGSAFVTLLSRTPRAELRPAAYSFVRALRQALDGAD